ncbi:MAG: hypothetical protein ACRC0G_07925 [Fusobacteriaceae bacterium]
MKTNISVLEKIGGYNVIPGFNIVSKYNSHISSTTAVMTKEGSEHISQLHDVDPSVLDKIANTQIISYGIVEFRHIGCIRRSISLCNNDDDCTLCTGQRFNGYRIEGDFRTGVLLTELNKKIYKFLSERINCDNSPSVVIAELMELYKLEYCNDSATAVMIVDGHELNCPKYMLQCTYRKIYGLFDPDVKYTEIEFIKEILSNTYIRLCEQPI